MSDARTEVLTRVHHALGDGPKPAAAADVASRTPRASADMLRLFCERAADNGATVTSTAPAGLRAALHDICRRHDIAQVVVAADFPNAWRPTEVMVEEDQGLREVLERVNATLTHCALAIAESGTIVLDGGPGQGRRELTLLPDLHICVLEEHQVVMDLSAAMANLGIAVRARRPLTLITGPSATSDIELQRIEGVHGPRRLALVALETLP